MEGQKKVHREIFQKFCSAKYLNGGKNTSKTVSKFKDARFKEVLKEEKMAIHSPKFKFWVTKTKKFKLLSIPELSLNSVHKLIFWFCQGLIK